MTYQQEIIKRYEGMGYFVIKLIKTNKNGICDLVCLKNGVTTWIEVKEANDTLKPLQKLRIDQLRERGFNAYCTKKGKGIIYPEL